MYLYEVIWKEEFADKIESKHGITKEEVEKVLFDNPHVRRVEKGRVKGEDLYSAYGCTEAGRYLIVFFVKKRRNAALPISARDMTVTERTYYAR